MSRLGLTTRWISSLGNDTFGTQIARGLANEEVQVFCTENNVNNTGLVIKTYAGKETPDVAYYRKDSAASRLDLKDVPSELISTARLIHITGIYPALSSTSLETTMQILEIAKQSSLLISFDVNYRPKLWDEAQARKVLPMIARYANIIFGSRDELELLVEEASGRTNLELLKMVGSEGCDVVLKRGPNGAMALIDGHVVERRAWPANVVDTVGAGDAFVGGFLSQYLENGPSQKCLAVATYCGAMTCENLGDWEGQARHSDLLADGILPAPQTKARI